MEDLLMLDARGYRRSRATLPGFHTGRPPRNRGRRYPADPPTTSEIVRLIRGCPETPSGIRLRALMIVLWRSGLRISEALALEERDLDEITGSITVRRGKAVAGECPGWTRGRGRRSGNGIPFVSLCRPGRISVWSAGQPGGGHSPRQGYASSFAGFNARAGYAGASRHPFASTEHRRASGSPTL